MSWRIHCVKNGKIYATVLSYSDFFWFEKGYIQLYILCCIWEFNFFFFFFFSETVLEPWLSGKQDFQRMG